MSRSTIIGIDPGLSGAIAFFDPHQRDRVEVFDLPNVAGVIDGRNLRGIVQRFSPNRAVLEDVHSMPKQGVASTFKFGRAFGTTIGVLECLGLSTTYVSPSKWKRHYGLDSDAEKSRRRALDLFPQSVDLFSRKKDHNRAEAALIARWGAFDERGIIDLDGFLLEADRPPARVGDRAREPAKVPRDLPLPSVSVDGVPVR